MRLTLHLVIFAAWTVTAVVLGLTITATSSEREAIARARGKDLRERRELAYRRAHLRLRLDQEATQERLEVALRGLGLLPGRDAVAVVGAGPERLR